MTTAYILKNWPLLEADFRREFYVDAPFDLTWRQFKMLLATLPGSSLLKSAWAYENKPENKFDKSFPWRKDLARVTGHQGAGVDRIVSLDQFMAKGGP